MIVLKRQLKKGKIVEVTWEDAGNATGWDTPDRAFKPLVSYTVGYVIKQNNKMIAIAQSYSGGSADDPRVVAEVMIIPLAYITKCRYL